MTIETRVYVKGRIEPYIFRSAPHYTTEWVTFGEKAKLEGIEPEQVVETRIPIKDNILFIQTIGSE